MRGKRIAAALTALALAAGLSLPVGAAAFTDTTGHWAESAIDKWSGEYGIIQGYEDGTFRPDNSITRGAFAGILDRFLKFQAISPTGTFSDAVGTYWENEVLKLHAAGVYLGNDGKALAGNPITRQQAVTMIARAFGITGASTALPYTDAANVAAYAQAPVAEMTARGYITDCADGRFRPTENITRAEIVNILNNMIDTLGQETTVYSGEIQGTLMINAVEGAYLKDLTVSGDLILAPGVSGAVVLENVEVRGAIQNLSNVELTVVEVSEGTENPSGPQTPDTPTGPGIQPSEVYTPSPTTGQYITYSNQQIPIYEGVEENRLGQGDFVWSTEHPGRLEYVGRDFDTRFGIDVSAYQNRECENNTIDWEAVRRDGVEFAMVRIGLRGYSTGSLNADAFYKQNIDGAMAAGIETGVYFFAQAITVEEAIEEAEFVLSLLEGHEINGPVAYDWEMHDSTYRVYGTTPEMATACAIAFCRRIEEAGYDAMVYAGQYVSYIKYDQGALEPYLSWYPEYKSASSEKLYPTLYYQMDYWQFSSSCPIAGIGDGTTTKVDANIQFLRR